MKSTKSTYRADWQGLSLAKIDQQMAAMPVSGTIDTINWKEQYPIAPETCVEMFIGNADNTRYWNFEFNPAGVCNASNRKERKVDVVRLNTEQLQSIQRFPVQLCAAHWSLLVGIPLSLIELDLTHERVRRANFYKCGDKTPMKHYASWNPIDAPAPAFHLPEFFGEIQFE